MNRIFLAAASLVVMVAATLTVPSAASADSGTCPVAAGAYGGGAGTSGSPYLIATPEHLQRLRDDSPSWGAAFRISADLDMTAGGSTCTWETSIGTAGTPFTGTLDGDGHAISELTISPLVSGTVHAGLFGHLSGGTVRDLDLDVTVAVNAQAQAASGSEIYAGLLVGVAANSAVIEGITAHGAVLATADDSVAPGSPEAHVGGLVGRIDSATTITAATASGSVMGQITSDDSVNPAFGTGEANAGGLLGSAGSGTSITDSSASGSVVITVSTRTSLYHADASAGGLVGRSAATISQSSASGLVSAGGVAATAAGGLVGITTANVSQSFATGSATANSASTDSWDGWAGGLIGRIIGGPTITNTYATGSASAFGGQLVDALAGGLVGAVDNAASVSSSYALGSVTAIGGSMMGTGYAGGAVGRNAGTLTDLVADSARGPGIGMGMPLTGVTTVSTSAMKDISTYQGLGWTISDTWDPSGTWALCSSVNSDYPFLAWEYDSNPGCNSAPEPSPSPSPAVPASAPRDVAAVAGDASAMVSWSAPASAGSFAVTNYLVTASPGGRICLTADLSCTVTRLSNGTAYTFRVQALTGAGWSASSDPSEAVTPAAPERLTITVTGTREGKRITVTGTSNGLGMGAILHPWVRMAGQPSYAQGSAQILVSMSGTFEWSRKTAKSTSIYVMTPDGTARSNTVTIR